MARRNRLGQAFAAGLTTFGNELPVAVESRRRKKLTDDALARQEKLDAQKVSNDNITQMFKQAKFALDQKATAEDLRRFEIGQSNTEENQRLAREREERLAGGTDEITAQNRLAGKDIRETNIRRLATDVQGRLAKINPEAVSKLGDVLPTNDPFILQQLLESEDFIQGGGDRPGLGTGDFPTFLDPTASAKLDTARAFEGTPVRDIAQSLQSTGRFDIGPRVNTTQQLSSPIDFDLPTLDDLLPAIDRDTAKRGGLSREQDALGRAIYDDWDKLTDEQKMQVILADQAEN